MKDERTRDFRQQATQDFCSKEYCILAFSFCRFGKMAQKMITAV